MQRLNIDDAMPIAHNIVNRTIEQAQSRVEGANFDTRKHLLEYDDVLNQQREVFYSQRDRVLTKDDLSEDLGEMLQGEVERHVQAAVEDLEGPWRLLAWLEEIQPTVDLLSPKPYPSFMLRLLSESIQDEKDPATVKAALLEIASLALETQHSHLQRAADEQLARVVERIQTQVRQRSEMAEMAIEGTLLEAEETGAPIDANALLRAVESAAGMRIQMDPGGMQTIRDDVDRFRDAIPQMIEASLGLRIWAGLIQAIERRVGESLGLEPKLQVPIDWDEAGDRIRDALADVWAARTERSLQEVERELDNALSGHDSVDEALKLQMLVQMSFGRREFFDRKTHQRRAVRVARLSYPFMAANLVDTGHPEALAERVLEHLDGALHAIKLSLGRSEISKLSSNRIDQWDIRWQQALRDQLGSETYDPIAAANNLAELPDELRENLAIGLGHVLLTEAYRSLFLSVADRLWVEYLTQMEALRTSIGLEAYGQRDPLVQYKSRAFDMFQQLLGDIRAGMVSRQFRVRPPSEAQPTAASVERQIRPAADSVDSADESKKTTKRKRRRKRRR
jgi:preprotein translocase subunit SecA